MKADMYLIEELRSAVAAAISAASGQDVTADSLVYPEDPANGDLAFPCFGLAKALKSAPPKIAADYSAEEIGFEKGKLEKGWNPRDIKAALAKRLVALYHGEKAAAKAGEDFIARFKKGEMPAEMNEIQWSSIVDLTDKGIKLQDLVAHVFSVSKSQARRDIEGGGVKVDGEQVRDPMALIKQGERVLQKGKLHLVKII